MRGDDLGLFEKIFGKKKEKARDANERFKLLNGYTPVFRNWSGSIYESDLIRAAIDAHGRHAAKLEPVLVGSARPELRSLLGKSPNGWQTWPQFLYRTATILYARNTAFIVPVLDEKGNTAGIYPILPMGWELVEYQGEVYIRFTFQDSEAKAIELSRVGILTRYQYKSELFGESNEALKSTLELIEIQRQCVTEAAKNSAVYRWVATMGNYRTDEDLAKERKRFDSENFQGGKGGGVLLFPNTYKDIKQVTPQSFSVDAEQLKVIQENVFNYFGVNAEVIQNKAYGDAWNAFYEGAVEWFAVNLSETITKMLFTDRERAFGNQMFFSSNRLQYMSNSDKLAVVEKMADRGLMKTNELRAIFNLPPLEGDLGDKIPARGEYFYVNDPDSRKRRKEKQDADEGGTGVQTN